MAFVHTGVTILALEVFFLLHCTIAFTYEYILRNSTIATTMTKNSGAEHNIFYIYFSKNCVLIPRFLSYTADEFLITLFSYLVIGVSDVLKTFFQPQNITRVFTRTQNITNRHNNYRDWNR